MDSVNGHVNPTLSPLQVAKKEVSKKGRENGTMNDLSFTLSPRPVPSIHTLGWAPSTLGSLSLSLDRK
jgi:hypothetical protein